MKQPDQRLPFVNVRHQANRTPSGRRSSSPARQAALYYAFGRDTDSQQLQKQRGEWIGPGAVIHRQEDVMAWVKENALTHRFTFQGLLSVPEGVLTPGQFAQVLKKAGQPEEWRLIVHDDTPHCHAHLLWFGDKRMNKAQFFVWQESVQTGLQQMERQPPTQEVTHAPQLQPTYFSDKHLNDRKNQKESGLGL